MRYLWLSLLIVPVVWAVRWSERSRDKVDIQSEMLAAATHFPNYAEKEAYYQKLIRRHHTAAFNWSYTVSGSRKTQNRFSVLHYLDMITTLMIQDADRDGEAEVMKILQAFNEGIKTEIRGFP